MAASNKNKKLSILRQFEPLASLTPGRLNELASICFVEAISKDLDPMRMNTQSAQLVYLVRGELGIRYINGSKLVLRAGSDDSHHPINGGRFQIQDTIALTPIEVVRIDADLLDIMMTWDQLSDNKPNNKNLFKHELADAHGRTTADWMVATDVFSAGALQNGVFSHLPPANIEEMFKRMVHITVTADQVIIKQGAEGDYYYLIERGTAVVTREKQGGSKILAELKAGSAFGEEALVSDNKRNATIVMKTDGELLRLNKTDFIELLKAPVINLISMTTAKEKVSLGAVWLDVRFASEYNFDHIANAINAPLNELRNITSTLDMQKEYIVYCQTGRRSEAAAFILVQYGLTVWVLEGGMRCSR